MMPAMQQQTGEALHGLLEGLVDDAGLASAGHIVVDGLSQDSRDIGQNYLFLALRGTASHGRGYAAQAVRAGASVVLWDAAEGDRPDVPQDVADEAVFIQVEDLRQKSGEIAARFFHHPSSELNLIGVTGTDGKTSVSHYIAQCMDSKAAPCGVLGTLGNGLVNDLQPTGLTTASAVQVQQSLASLVAKAASAAVMEVSSHGLDQGRVHGVCFDTAVFTNLSQDHLDYHGNMEAYASAKAKLFAVDGLKSAVINLDDEFGRVLAQKYRNSLTVFGYSTSSDFDSLASCADFVVHAKNIQPQAHGFDVNVATPKGTGYFQLGLLGSFNVSNALAVLSTLLLNNVAFEESLKRIQAITPVAGRMELITAENKPTVIVDYAHTPQGLAAACIAAKQHFSGRLWCVFGCGGDRDRDKRPLMAQAAERFADYVIVTSDNPRHEDPDEIIRQILAGFVDTGHVECHVERRQAIASALSKAAADDVVLLAGKGHESCQIIGDKYIVFDDRSVARALLDELNPGVRE
jgi:UDP-N-acetylmuramoyl-L-alanyl-D-glutamate--2,6-diaminopimelate ligase